LLQDQSQCWHRGECLPVETYLAIYPDLAADCELVLDLICHEVLLRSRRGEGPKPDEYLKRFPDLAEDLLAQFEVHQALGAVDRGSWSGEREDRTTAPVPLARVAGYDVLQELGRGAMGVVYLARHCGLKRLVALKMIQVPAQDCPRRLARFRGEAEVLARLQHPNIVQIYEVGESEGRPFFALEYLPGGGLDRRLNGNPQPPRAAAQLLWTLARAIEAAHQAGVVHRDLKPANVLLTADETPKITDFGLAKQLDGADQTSTGEILGTPHYMAPEQACGRRGTVGPWTDVYALGAIFYEMLTGRPPFNGSSVWDTLEQVVTLDPVPPTRLQAKVPRDLEVICLKCLAKFPARRYAHAGDLAGDLRRFLSSEPIRARPVPVWERAWRWARRRPTLAALGAAGLLSLVVVLGAGVVWLRASASQARLEAHEARQREAVALSLADIKDGLRQVESARDAQRWSEAHAWLDGVIRQLDLAQQTFPATGPFADLRGRVEELRRPIEQRLTVRDRLARFRMLRTEVGFLVMGLAGTDLGARQDRAGKAVAEALALFGAKPGSGQAVSEPDQFPVEERLEVREGCCEMLLGLAQLTPPGEQALALLDQASQLQAALGVCHSRRSHCLAQMGRSLEAQREKERARAHPPSRAFEFFLSGSDLYSAGDLRGAIAAFETALSRGPNHAAAAYALALPHLRLRLQADQPAVARAHLVVARMSLTACINQQPGLPWPYLCRAFALGELGEHQSADADFATAEQLLRSRPDESARYALLVSRGALRIRGNDLIRAIQDLTEALRIKPGDYQAHINLARAYQLRGQKEEALRQMDQALTLGPPSAQAALHRTRARLHQEAGRTAEAVRDLEQSVRLESDGKSSLLAAEDLLTKGRLLAQAQDYVGAAQALDASLEKRPNDPATLRARAEVLLHLQRDEDALRDLDRLLEGRRDPAQVRALYRARAQVRARAGDHPGAIEDYTQVLSAGPDLAGHVGRGWTYLALEAPALAQGDFDRAIGLDPRDADAHNGRAFARIKLGRCRDAVDDAEQALRLGPTTARHRYNAARVFAQAILKAEEAEAPHPSSFRAGVAGSQEVRLGYQERAVALLREALTALPREEQPGFWTRTVQRDSALDPIRSCAGFRRLAMTFGVGPPDR
jgi:tetratricopeptide (TPR) repeat protein/tRNA A-37 threonylcarbamoyl transferase component Bud32